MAASLTVQIADYTVNYPDGDGFMLVWATSQRSAGINRPSPKSYRLIKVEDLGADFDPGTPMDILAAYVAKFGALISGRKIFFKLALAFQSTSMDGPHGIQSLPTEASIVVA